MSDSREPSPDSTTRIERRKDLDTAVQFELARIYIDVFGCASSVIYFARFSLDSAQFEKIAQRKRRRVAHHRCL